MRHGQSLVLIEAGLQLSLLFLRGMFSTAVSIGQSCAFESLCDTPYSSYTFLVIYEIGLPLEDDASLLRSTYSQQDHRFVCGRTDVIEQSEYIAREQFSVEISYCMPHTLGRAQHQFVGICFNVYIYSIQTM